MLTNTPFSENYIGVGVTGQYPPGQYPTWIICPGEILTWGKLSKGGGGYFQWDIVKGDIVQGDISSGILSRGILSRGILVDIDLEPVILASFGNEGYFMRIYSSGSLPWLPSSSSFHHVTLTCITMDRVYMALGQKVPSFHRLSAADLKLSCHHKYRSIHPVFINE